MKLIEPDEMAQFWRTLAERQLRRDDFQLSESETTDPQSDELLPIQGRLLVRCLPTGQVREYEIGDGSIWPEQFRRDVQRGLFAAPAAPKR
ncbi:transcriptional regulator [Pseudoduganella sp. OTU4001]|uniref:transcriptional regulator n=1 Tax=Pseudoduganella sp. OTU4001 TaxID=3043854 RepID=UPI00313BCB37